MYCEEVFRALEKNGVKYVVVGGVALILHGIVRFTADLDLMIQMEEDNIEKFISTMDELGYKPNIARFARDVPNGLSPLWRISVVRQLTPKSFYPSGESTSFPPNLLMNLSEIGEFPKGKIPVPARDFADPVKRAQWKEEKGMEVVSFFTRLIA